ncbi:MAG: nuclear transport factor 2 family protein [Sphingobacteriales bacterium]|nr:MAG: nuclear transport factor 2 family protein [Sphingobacteriales bacterium]
MIKLIKIKKLGRVILVLIMAGTVSSGCSPTSPSIGKLEASLEILRLAMADPNEAVLNKLTSEKLSYGHSSGLIENKQEFISSLASGKYNFLTIHLSDQDISIADDVAIVRHTLSATTHDMGKSKASINLKVLLVWKLKDGEWILLARQAVKVGNAL